MFLEKIDASIHTTVELSYSSVLEKNIGSKEMKLNSGLYTALSEILHQLRLQLTRLPSIQ